MSVTPISVVRRRALSQLRELPAFLRELAAFDPYEDDPPILITDDLERWARHLELLISLDPDLSD